MSIRAPLLFLSLLLLPSGHTLAQDHQHYAPNGRANPCSCSPCDCSEWLVTWARPDGRVWGLSFAKSRQEAEAIRDREQAQEDALGRFFRRMGGEYSYSYDRPTICCRGCILEDQLRAQLGKNLRSAIRTAGRGWAAGITKGLTPWLGLFNKVNPGTSTGDLVRDFARNMDNSRRNLSGLQQRLEGVQLGGGGPALSELRQLDQELNRLEADLGEAVRIRKRVLTNESRHEVGPSCSCGGKRVAEQCQENQGTWRRVTQELEVAVSHPRATTTVIPGRKYEYSEMRDERGWCRSCHCGPSTICFCWESTDSRRNDYAWEVRVRNVSKADARLVLSPSDGDGGGQERIVKAGEEARFSGNLSLLNRSWFGKFRLSISNTADVGGRNVPGAGSGH